MRVDFAAGGTGLGDGGRLRLAALAARRFRSLYDITLPLKPLNIVIGPNGSGKSNLVRLLRFTRDAATEATVGERYRSVARDLVWYGLVDGKQAQDFTVSLSFESPTRSDDGPLRYTLRVDTAAGELAFPHEVLEREGFTPPLSRTGQRAEVRGGEEVISLPISPSVLALQYLTPLTLSPVMQAVQKAIGGWRFFSVDVEAARRSTIGTHPEKVPPLRPDAGNLSQFLYALQLLREDEFAEVVERMSNAVEFLEDVTVESSPSVLGAEAEHRYLLKERAFGERIAPQSASDGTIRLLALLALLIGDHSPTLVCLEEPDHNLHPHLMLHLADAMRAVAAIDEGPQIIVTTHSPDFLDCFDPDTERDYLNVFIAHKDPVSGKTVFRQADADRLGHWMEGYRLGELHRMGLLDSYARGER